MSIRARQLLLSFLVCAFLVQTWLVYSDPAGTERSLSPLAGEGQEIWRSRNCQSCHQLFGFGGFLGPDLTNAVTELSAERLKSILTDGAGQMPAFRMDEQARLAVATYLREIDATGVSQPQLGDVLPPAELLRQLSETDGPLAPDVARGREIVMTQNCIACHLPNDQSLHRSPDLTRISASLEKEKVLTILHDGLPEKGMPRLGLSRADGEAVLAFLTWMGASGETIRARFESLATDKELRLSRIPWFEYE